MKSKSKKYVKLITSLLVTSLLVGYSNESSKIKFPGGAYVRENGIQKNVNYDNFYYVEDGRVYFTMYDEIQDITDYCSNETYFVDQVRIGGHRQTIVIGGDVSEKIDCVAEFGWILELDDPNIHELELEAIKNEKFIGTSRYYNTKGPTNGVMYKWIENAENDLKIDFYR